jgi:ABC-2 type transport system permease protein
MNKLLKQKYWWIFLLALVIGINFAASLFYKRFDLTAEKRYSLSNSTKNILRNLKEPVEVEVFLKGQFPAGFKRLANATKEFLEECKSYSKGNLNIIFTDPLKGLADSTAANLMDSLQYFYGITPNRLGDLQMKLGEEQQSKLILPGAVVKNGSRKVGINLLRGTQQLGTDEENLAAMYNQIEATLEYKFADAINKVSQSKKPIIGYALGNGQPFGYNIDDAFKSLKGKPLVYTPYNFDTININILPFIPEQLDALIILKPTLPFTELQKLKIDQYVMRGGNVFWMIDNMFADFDSLQRSANQSFVAFDRGLNLDDLLFKYGVRINQNLLQDLQSDVLPLASGTQEDGQKSQLLPFCFFPILNGGNHPITKNLDGIRAMFPNTIDTIKNDIKKTILLRSSANAKIIGAPFKVDFEFMQYINDPKQFGVKDTSVAVLLEGNFSSFFANRLSSSLTDSLKAYNRPYLDKAIKPGKMIVVADGDIAMNMFSQSQGPLKMGENIFTKHNFANKDFYLNSIEYLTNNAAILDTRGKDFTLRLLDPVKKENNADKWKVLTTVVPIALLLVFGMVYGFVRKRKYVK